MQIKAIIFILAALNPAPMLAGEAPSFTPVSMPPHRYTGGWEFFVGGGVATFDCNGDMLPELFVAGGAGPARLMRNVTARRGGTLAFVRDTPPELTLEAVIGAYPLDIDSDGIMDLAVLRLGQNLLLRGRGNCRFEQFPDALGFTSGDRWTTAFSATWEAGQTLPTLAFGNYVDRSNPEGPFRACDVNMLYRPKGDRYDVPMPLAPGFCALSALFSDWGHRGRADLRLSNDRHYYVDGGAEQLWAMEEAPRLYTAEEGWKTYNLWGMGIASRDISGDGFADVFLSSMGDQKLQFFDPQAGGPAYVDATFARGTAAQRPYTGDDGRPSTGWHIAFGDAQNDGLDDVFITKGNVQQMPGLAMRDPNNLLVQQPDGRFVEMGDVAGLADMARGRGAAFEDLNLDGLPDIVVVNRADPVRVWQNRTPDPGHWLLLDIRQPAPNVNAIGAFVEITDGTHSWTRELTVGGGHASGAATLRHFGLGSARTVRLRVIWPGGTASPWQEVATDRIWRIERAPGGLRISPL